MKDFLLHEEIEMTDKCFPVKVTPVHFSYPGIIFESHWHEHIELMYFNESGANITCGQNSFNVQSGDLIVINSCEVHSGVNLSRNLDYYLIFIDINMLQKNNYIGPCESKYITPIAQNLILFKSRINDDSELAACVRKIIHEYNSKEISYELSILSSVYQLLTILLRRHVERFITPNEYNDRVKNLERFDHVFEYIENNYAEKINTDKLASVANMSTYYFCRLFKEVVGQTPGEYISRIRINKAEQLLSESNQNVSEVAMSTGFNDISYFSRLFKKYKNYSPSEFRKMRPQKQSSPIGFD